MTTTLDTHPRNDSGSFSLLHGVYGGNDERGLKGRFACFLLQRTHKDENGDIIFSFVFFFSLHSDGVHKGVHPKEERILERLERQL